MLWCKFLCRHLVISLEQMPRSGFDGFPPAPSVGHIFLLLTYTSFDFFCCWKLDIFDHVLQQLRILDSDFSLLTVNRSHSFCCCLFSNFSEIREIHAPSPRWTASIMPLLRFYLFLFQAGLLGLSLCFQFIDHLVICQRLCSKALNQYRVRRLWIKYSLHLVPRICVWVCFLGLM